jgi:hypothetical protein
LSGSRLFLSLAGLAFGLFLGADRTGLGSASAAAGFFVRLLGADRTRLFAASTALAFAGCRRTQGRAGTGQQSGQADAGQYLFQVIFFHGCILLTLIIS